MPPGRSALPALLVVERSLAEELAAEQAKVAREAEHAGEEAARIRRAGEERLQRVLVEAQEAALREVEARARERVNAARSAVTRWVDASERAATAAVDDALDLCTGE